MSSSSATKTVLVTGANKGLGYHSVRLLAHKHPQWTIILTSRDKQKVEDAIKKLHSQDGVDIKNVHALELDVSSSASIKQAAQQVKEKYGHIDYLLQNAGISGWGMESDLKTAEGILQTNVTGVMEMQEAFQPLLKNESLTVVVSSEVGAWAMSDFNPSLHKIFDDIPALSTDKLKALHTDYLKTWQQGAKTDNEWPDAKKTFNAYGISKAFLNAYLRVYLRDHPNARIVMVTPGYCATDLNANSGPRSAEQGATSDIWPIVHDNQVKNGAFYYDGEEQAFTQEKPAHYS